MASIEKRLNDLESKKAKQSDSWHYLRLRDDGRLSGGFRCFRPFYDHVCVVPTADSTWGDGSRVFDSLSCPPVDGMFRDLSDEQWNELRSAEPSHQRRAVE